MDSLFDKVNAGFDSLPMATGKKVFLAADYAKHIQRSARIARERLQRLVTEGKVRRVLTKRDGRVVPAWEYIG